MSHSYHIQLRYIKIIVKPNRKIWSHEGRRRVIIIIWCQYQFDNEKISEKCYKGQKNITEMMIFIITYDYCSWTIVQMWPSYYEPLRPPPVDVSQASEEVAYWWSRVILEWSWKGYIKSMAGTQKITSCVRGVTFADDCL